MSDKSNPQPVRFTRKQVEYLEKLYPEITSLRSHEEMAYSMGQRSVVVQLRARMLRDGEADGLQ